MKRIAIIGAESSHAAAYTKFITQATEASELEIVGVWSDEQAAAKKLAEKYGVKIMSRPDECVGNIDGLIVTTRDGSTHYTYAKPYIQSGICMLIDKPITVSEADALSFMAELRKKNVRAIGGSTLKHDPNLAMLKQKSADSTDGLVKAPLMSNSKYGGFFFYAEHLVDIVCELFGRYPKSVSATKNGDQTIVKFNYGTHSCTGIYCENDSRFFAEVYTPQGNFSQTIADCGLEALLFSELAEFQSLLNGAAAKQSYSDLFSPVFIMNAIMRALQSKNEEYIRYSC
jgi:hypothetical protein